MQIPQYTSAFLDDANHKIECADDWISCFLGDPSFTEAQSLPLHTNLDASLQGFLSLENDEPKNSMHSVSVQNCVGLADSPSFCSLLETCHSVEGISHIQTPPQNPLSIFTQKSHTDAPAVPTSSNSGLSQSSFLTNSSDQDLCKIEDFDATLFIDSSFANDYFEEIATSKLEITEETLQTLNENQVNQLSGEGSAIGSELIQEQGVLNSDVIHVKEPKIAAQTGRAEVSGKRKGSRKRKTPSESSDDPQSDLNDAERSNETGEVIEDEEKRQARLMRNRESAQLSRHRKKVYVDELQEKLKTMASTIAELNNTIGLISAENVNLRTQLAYFYQAHGPSVKPGIPPITYPGYIGARPFFPGLHAPPVPIPRLKPQASSKSSKKAKASAASNGRSKGSMGVKTKRLIGAATMGLCLVMMILAPLSSNNLAKEGAGNSSMNPTKNQEIRVGGRVLMSTNRAESSPSILEPNISWSTSVGNTMRKKLQLNVDGKEARATMEGSENTHTPAMDCYTLTGGNRNGSAAYFVGDIFAHNITDPLAASLFVRRNDKLVKIDGSLIIQAIMSGDKAAQQSKKEDSNKRYSAERGIMPTVAGPGVPVGLVAFENEGSKQNDAPVLKNHKALPSNQHVQNKTTQFPDSETYGSVQQWLMSDFAGTILSTGTCTEVFQFETSPVPQKNETRASYQRSMTRKPSQHSNLPRSHKNLGRSFPLPPVRQSTGGQNAADRYRVKDPLAEPTKRLYRHQNERRWPSSMVVSVLSGDDGGSKGISNIFVVVLLDSVKYVTYSCMLPSSGPRPQLVTA